MNRRRFFQLLASAFAVKPAATSVLNAPALVTVSTDGTVVYLDCLKAELPPLGTDLRYPR